MNDFQRCETARTVRADHTEVTVTLEPADHPEIVASFEFIAAQGVLRGPYGLRLESKTAPDGERPRLGVALLRDLPIARWERAARLAAQVPSEVIDNDAAVEDLAVRVVRSLHPDVDPNAGKAGARTWAKLTRYAQVTLQWHRAQIAGAPDPAGAVADKHGVSPATVRSWLHRAKQDGITAETVGRALGEAVTS